MDPADCGISSRNLFIVLNGKPLRSLIDGAADLCWPAALFNLFIELSLWPVNLRCYYYVLYAKSSITYAPFLPVLAQVKKRRPWKRSDLLASGFNGDNKASIVLARLMRPKNKLRLNYRPRPGGRFGPYLARFGHSHT